MFQFSDPVVGGTTLIRPAIRSPNYVTGVSGWTVNVDGSAEFNNLTVRGTFFGTSYEIGPAGAFFYAPTFGAGNLITSVTTAAGTDSFGNAYLSGTTGYQKITGTLWEACQVGTVQGLAFYTAASEAGPWLEVGAIQPANGDIELIPNRYGNVQAPLALLNQSSDASALTGYALAYGLGGHLKYVCTDGTVYDTGRATLVTPSTQTISATSPGVAITGLSGTIQPGTYRVSGLIFYTENAAAGAPSFYFTAPTGTNVLYSMLWRSRGAASPVFSTGTATALGAGSALAGPTMATANKVIEVDGIFTATGATGGWALNAFTSAGADTFTIQPQSFLDLLPVA